MESRLDNVLNVSPLVGLHCKFLVLNSLILSILVVIILLFSFQPRMESLHLESQLRRAHTTTVPVSLAIPPVVSQSVATEARKNKIL